MISHQVCQSLKTQKPLSPSVFLVCFSYVATVSLAKPLNRGDNET